MANNPEFVKALSEALKKIGTVRAVGDQWVSVHGIIPKGGLPYMGQEVSREAYSALWQWVQDNNLVITESEWQSASTSQNGNVSKYSSGDGSTTFRLPKILGYIKCADTLGGAGVYTQEGLPNITGQIGAYGTEKNHCTASGAFSINSGSMTYGADHTAAAGAKFDFSAQNSNPIYGGSAHVTPETMGVIFGVYAFGEVTNVGAVDLGSLAQQLSEISTTYLPTAGGEMRGNVNLADGVYFYGAGGSSTGFHAYAGKNNFDGATLQLFSWNHPSYPGRFYLRCSNRVDGAAGTGNQYTLVANPETGVLTWENGTFKAPIIQATSDYRLKSDVTDYSADLSSLGTYRYTLNADGKKHIGLIAQEVKEVIPEAVSTDEEGFYSLDYNAIVAVLVGKVNDLEARLAKLEG